MNVSEYERVKAILKRHDAEITELQIKIAKLESKLVLQSLEKIK